MTKLSKLAAVMAAVPVLAMSGAALADSPGQLVGGPNFYVVKNLTQNGTFASSASVACNQEVQYSAELHNPMNGGLTNVKVSANLANGSISAIPAEGASQGATGSVSVNVASGGSLNYESGSTVLKDSNGNTIRTLSDGITSGGVNVGNVNGSTVEFVDFKAKVSCPAPTPTPTPTPTPKPTTLPNTGAGDVLGIFTGVSSLGAAGHYVVSRRRK